MDVRIEEFRTITDYPDTLFETIRVEGGVPLFYREHLERFSRAVKARFGETVSPEEFRSNLKGLIPEGDQGLRVLCTRKLELVVSVRPLEELKLEGLAVASRTRDGRDRKYRYKTSDYQERLEDLAAIRKEGWFENVYLDQDGFLTSCSVSNLFFIRGGVLHTPALERGVLDGIVRSVICRYFPVREGECGLEELMAADAVFVTNSLIGIREIRKVGGRTLASRNPLLEEVRRIYEQAKEESRREYLG